MDQHLPGFGETGLHLHPPDGGFTDRNVGTPYYSKSISNMELVKMRVMAIDVGTNSTLHLVADITEKGITLIERGIVGNSLGIGIGSDGSLDAELLNKNREILRLLAEKAHKMKCKRVGAVGTQALRRASNADDFLNMAGKAGISMRIISNEEEASLTWTSVFGSQGSDRLTGLLDLGGGSSELVIGQGASHEWMDSVSMGAVTLARDFFHQDPPSSHDRNAAKNAVLDRFADWCKQSERSFKLTGVAGTVTALAAIEQGITEYIPGCLEGLKVSHDIISKWRSKLLSFTLDQRRSIIGMPPARAESIHAGVLILDAVLTILDKDEITVSERGVIFGLAMKLAD